VPEPQQGQVWTATSRLSGRTTTVVLLDSDVVIRQRPMLVVAPVRPVREVPSRHQLLTVAFGTDEVVALYDLATLPKESLTEQTSVLPPEVMEQVRVGLRARFDL
jgi:mRNA-degrading endonuclease toxin of MazEF toxin-antitoxin module